MCVMVLRKLSYFNEVIRRKQNNHSKVDFVDSLLPVGENQLLNTYLAATRREQIQRNLGRR